MIVATAAMYILIITTGSNVQTVQYEDKKACQEAAQKFNSHYVGSQKRFYHAHCTATSTEESDNTVHGMRGW